MMIEQYVWGQLLMTFRKWIPSTTEAWWGGFGDAIDNAFVTDPENPDKTKFKWVELAKPDTWQAKYSLYSGKGRIGRLSALTHYAAATSRYLWDSMLNGLGMLKHEQNLIEAKMFLDPHYFTAEEKAALREALVSIGMVLMTYFGRALYKSLEPPEDRKKKKKEPQTWGEELWDWSKSFATYVILRTAMENRFYYNPSDIFDIIQTPVAGSTTL